MPLSKYLIGGIQLKVSPDIDDNLMRAVAFIDVAAAKGAKVICLPELFRSQYFCQTEDFKMFDLAESVPGPTIEAMQAAAKKNRVSIVVPFFEKRAAGLYHNSAAIIGGDGAIAGMYRKMHIPDDPSYYEKYYFTPGDMGFKVITTEHANIGTLICWDQWYPEGARITALQNADVLFYPTAIGWHPKEKERYGERQLDAWRTVQRGHAIANGIYVAAINRTGLEHFTPGTDGIEFFGSSFICDPQGVVLAQASAENEEIIYAEVDLHHTETVRRNWPFLRDRRIDAYQPITQRFIDGKEGEK